MLWVSDRRAVPSAGRAGMSIGDRNRFAVLESTRKKGGRGAEEREGAPDPGQRAILEAEREGGGAERWSERVADVEGGLVQRRGEVRAVDRFPHHPRLQRNARREEQKAPEDHSGADERNAVDDSYQANIENGIGERECCDRFQ